MNYKFYELKFCIELHLYIDKKNIIKKTSEKLYGKKTPY